MLAQKQTVIRYTLVLDDEEISVMARALAHVPLTPSERTCAYQLAHVLREAQGESSVSEAPVDPRPPEPVPKSTGATPEPPTVVAPLLDRLLTQPHYSITQAASLAEMPLSTLRAWIQQGTVPTEKSPAGLMRVTAATVRALSDRYAVARLWLPPAGGVKQSGPFAGVKGNAFVTCAGCGDKQPSHKAQKAQWPLPDLCYVCALKTEPAPDPAPPALEAAPAPPALEAAPAPPALEAAPAPPVPPAPPAAVTEAKTPNPHSRKRDTGYGGENSRQAKRGLRFYGSSNA
jgi:hypothetical protein